MIGSAWIRVPIMVSNSLWGSHHYCNIGRQRKARRKTSKWPKRRIEKDLKSWIKSMIALESYKPKLPKQLTLRLVRIPLLFSSWNIASNTIRASFIPRSISYIWILILRILIPISRIRSIASFELIWSMKLIRKLIVILLNLMISKINTGIRVHILYMPFNLMFLSHL